MGRDLAHRPYVQCFVHKHTDTPTPYSRRHIQAHPHPMHTQAHTHTHTTHQRASDCQSLQKNMYKNKVKVTQIKKYTCVHVKRAIYSCTEPPSMTQVHNVESENRDQPQKEPQPCPLLTKHTQPVSYTHLTLPTKRIV